MKEGNFEGDGGVGGWGESAGRELERERDREGDREVVCVCG